MSSAISTKETGSGAGTVAAGAGSAGPYQAAGPGSTTGGSRPSPAGLLPWQFFVLAALGCATAVNVMVRGQGIVTIILVTLLVGSTALVGIAALRTLNPLVTEEDDRTAVIGGRTRAALEREKVLTLRAIKELEFDRAMGKVSDADFDEMSGRLRTRAARLMRQLDAGAGYREQIERDLAKRLDGSVDAERDRKADGSAKASAARSSERRCACGSVNDADAKYCKSCGAKL